MPGSGRPPPPLTLVVPDRGASTDLLGPPDRPELPPHVRALLLLVVAVLAAGVLVGVRHDDVVRPAPAPGPVEGTAASSGISVELDLVQEQPLSAVLDLVVSIPPLAGRPGSTAGPSSQLKLVDVLGRGMAVRLLRRSPPLLLAHLGRITAGAGRVLHLPAEVVVSDCARPPGGQRAVLLLVQLADGPVRTLPARHDLLSARAVDGLVRRTCRG